MTLVWRLGLKGAVMDAIYGTKDRGGRSQILGSSSERNRGGDRDRYDYRGFQALHSQGNQLKLQQKQLAVQQSQFEATSKEQAKALEEEYHRRFWEKKLEVYIQLCHAAGILALTEPTSDEYLQAQHQLKMIYSGELQLLASSEVKTALGNFLNALSSTSIIKSRDLDSETPAIVDRVKKGEKVI